MTTALSITKAKETIDFPMQLAPASKKTFHEPYINQVLSDISSSSDLLKALHLMPSQRAGLKASELTPTVKALDAAYRAKMVQYADLLAVAGGEDLKEIREQIIKLERTRTYRIHAALGRFPLTCLFFPKGKLKQWKLGCNSSTQRAATMIRIDALERQRVADSERILAARAAVVQKEIEALNDAGETDLQLEKEQAQLRLVNVALTIETTVKVHFKKGADLYLRGGYDGKTVGGLSWNEGIKLQESSEGGIWEWKTTEPFERVDVKVLLNDKKWQKGKDFTLRCSHSHDIYPRFSQNQTICSVQ